MTAIHRREMLGIMLGGAVVATAGLALMPVPAESAPLGSAMSATGHGSDKADEFDTRAGKLLASTSTMALRSDTFEGAMGMT
jgi:hypothetical protein